MPQEENKDNNMDRQILTLRQVEDLTGLKRVTLWRLEKKSDFPRRLKLTDTKIGWRKNQVEAWIDEKTAKAGI